MKKFGTREEVINGLSKQTRGGLTKQFLKYNAEGKIISIRRRKQRGGVVPDFKQILEAKHIPFNKINTFKQINSNLQGSQGVIGTIMYKNSQCIAKQIDFPRSAWSVFDKSQIPVNNSKMVIDFICDEYNGEAIKKDLRLLMCESDYIVKALCWTYNITIQLQQGLLEHNINSFDIDAFNNNPRFIYLIMEKGDGTLTKYIETIHSNYNLTVPIILNIVSLALNIARGIQYLQQIKITHADLKPDNIILFDNNTKAKLTDLGVSIVHGNKKSKGGTYTYLPPEAFEIYKNIRKSSNKRPLLYTKTEYNTDTDMPNTIDLSKIDVYSFGLVLNYMLTGKSIDTTHYNIKKDTMKILYEMLLKNIRPDTNQSDNHTIRELNNLINKCWDTNPGKRPTIDKVINKLEQIYDSANKSERSLFNNNPDELSLDVNIGTANENTDLAKMYKEVNVNPIKKLEYNQVYLVVDGDITYQNYIKFIYDIINKRKEKTTIYIDDTPILVYKYSDTSNLFLINKLECDSSVQMIKSVKFEFNYTLDMPNRIDITKPNATFYTEFPNNCGEPDIDAIIQSLQSIKGGNPSHIHTGKRGGRFVVVGGKRRYLRK